MSTTTDGFLKLVSVVVVLKESLLKEKFTDDYEVEVVPFENEHVKGCLEGMRLEETLLNFATLNLIDFEKVK